MTTEYPIILVHGLMIRHFKRFRAFGHIGKALKDESYDVYISTHDGFGSIETNALQIKNFVMNVLKETGKEKVNIIAHSKGGLDVKHALSDPDFLTRVASLTTLSTPHKGSVLASAIWKLPMWMKKTAAFFINSFYRIIGDKHPDALKACMQLREESEYDRSVPSGVLCRSYSARMRRSRDCFVMCIPNQIYKHLAGTENDGMVTPDSAKFGEYMGDCLDESLSHAQMVDFLTSKKKRKRVLEFYIKLCLDLSEMGY